MDHQSYYAAAATISLSILLLSIISYLKTSLKRKTAPSPPGPRGLPIVGYLPFLGQNLLHQFTDLGHKYGPIYKLYLGNKLHVVIGSPPLAKEVLRDHDAIFSGRDITAAAFVATYGGNDIAWSPQLSPQWRVMRKVFAQEMMSNKSLEASYSLRRDEVRKAIKHVYNNKIGKRIEIGELSFRTELNVVMNMLWGGTIDGEDGERIAAEFRVVVSKLVDLLGEPNISDFFPVVARFDIQGVRKRMEGYVQSVDKIFDAVISEHKKKLCGGIKNEEKDFLQILLELMGKGDSEISINQRQLKALLMDIVGGGTDTSATTVEWAMAELMNHPKVMAKAQKELSDVVGLNNMVEEFHMPKLKYLEAIVKETLRLHPAVPLLVPRSPIQSSTVGGYTIPKNTRVFVNVWWIQRDPSIWDNPSKFNPERFLDENGKWDYSGNQFEYLPFGSGRRICAGRPLAERMLAYLLASLLHSFDWKLAEDEKVDMEETFRIVLRKSRPLVAIPNPRLLDSNLYL